MQTKFKCNERNEPATKWINIKLKKGYKMRILRISNAGNKTAKDLTKPCYIMLTLSYMKSH